MFQDLHYAPMHCVKSRNMQNGNPSVVEIGWKHESLLHCVRFPLGWRNQWHDGIKGPGQSSSLVSIRHVLPLPCLVVSLHQISRSVIDICWL